MKTSTPLRIRRIDFDFDDVVFDWNPSMPRFGMMMNVVSFVAIAFEKYVVSVVRKAKPRITDPDVAQEAEGFLRQEAQHAAAHRLHVRALAKAHPGLAGVLDETVAEYDRLLDDHPLEFHLAYIADLEATFTPVFKLWLDHHETLFRPGDERVASLFLWHFVEEVEHRSSALILYDHLVRNPWYRVRIAPQVMRHIGSLHTRIVEGFEAHVPWDDRRAEGRDLAPATLWRHELTNRLPRVSGQHRVRDGGMFPGASARELSVTLYRLMLSQAPGHDPAHEPLPAFADRWFESFDRGEDVKRWYSAARTP